MSQYHARSSRRVGPVILLLAVATLAAACGQGQRQAVGPGGTGSAATQEQGQQAQHVERPDCPPLPRLDRPPRRIVTMDGSAAAILSELGLRDRIVGTAAPDFFTAFPPEQRAELERIPVIDPGQGNAEKVLDARPDLVVGVSSYSFGGFDGTPTADRLAKAGAPSLVACGGGAPVTDLTATTRFVRDAAQVLGVPERGERLAERIQSTVESAGADRGADRPRVLALSGPPAPGQPVATQGGASLANGVITLAGGRNVAEDVRGDFASLSAEEIVARDPEVIVVISGFGSRSDRQLSDAVRSSPVLAGTTAVRQNRLVVVPQSILLSPNVLNAEAVRTLAGALQDPSR